LSIQVFMPSGTDLYRFLGVQLRDACPAAPAATVQVRTVSHADCVERAHGWGRRCMFDEHAGNGGCTWLVRSLAASPLASREHLHVNPSQERPLRGGAAAAGRRHLPRTRVASTALAASPYGIQE
jgi:hypothetical protein